MTIRVVQLHADGPNTGPRAVPPRPLGLTQEKVDGWAHPLAYKDGARVHVVSRNGRGDRTRRFAGIAATLGRPVFAGQLVRARRCSEFKSR